MVFLENYFKWTPAVYASVTNVFSPQEAHPARENSSRGFIEAVHQW